MHSYRTDKHNIFRARFRLLPPVIYSLPKLEVLLASDNQIESIDAGGIKELTQLATLDLRNNSISQVPPVLGLCEQIRQDYKKWQKSAKKSSPWISFWVRFCNSNDLRVHWYKPYMTNGRCCRSLQLEGNAFRMPRPAILAKGTVTILDYLRGRIPTS